LKALAELALAQAELARRIAEQAQGSKDPTVVKRHQKSIEQARNRVKNAAEAVARHCKETMKNIMSAIVAFTAASTTCVAAIAPEPCTLHPEWCCDGKFVGPGAVCVY
jgi:hypothetical protein